MWDGGGVVYAPCGVVYPELGLWCSMLPGCEAALIGLDSNDPPWDGGEDNTCPLVEYGGDGKTPFTFTPGRGNGWPNDCGCCWLLGRGCAGACCGMNCAKCPAPEWGSDGTWWPFKCICCQLTLLWPSYVAPACIVLLGWPSEMNKLIFFNKQTIFLITDVYVKCIISF